MKGTGLQFSKTLLRSIWFRVALFYVVIFSLSLLCVLALIMLIGRNYMEQQIRARINTEMQFLLYEYQEEGLAEVLEETEERIDRRTPANMLLYVVENAEGQTIFDPFPTPSSQPGWHLIENRHGDEHRYLILYRQLDNGYLLGIGSNLSAIDDFRSAVQRAVLWTVVISLLVGAAFGILFGVFFSSRLRAVIQAVQAVAHGKLYTRLSRRDGSFEFELLTRELNGMFQKIEMLVANLKHVSSGLAHDLRTPLCILKNHLEDAGDPEASREQISHALDRAGSELDNLLRHFDSALLIVELESGELAQRFEPVELSSLIDTMLESYRPLLEDAEIEISAEIARPLHVTGMPSLLQRLVSNIFDNVLLHGAKPGAMAVHCALTTDRTPVIAVRISSKAASVNEEIKIETRPDLQRLHKGSGKKIIEAIVALHGGSMTIDAVNGHYTYEIRLPVETSRMS